MEHHRQWGLVATLPGALHGPWQEVGWTQPTPKEQEVKLELVPELVMDQEKQEVASLEKEQRHRHLHHLGALLRQPVSWQGGLEVLPPCHHDPQVGAEGLHHSP